MKTKRFSRRDFLRASSLTAAGLIAAACAPAVTQAPAVPAATSAPGATSAPAATQPPAATGTPVPPTAAPTATRAVPTLAQPSGSVKVSWWGESPDAPQEDWLTQNFLNAFNGSHTDVYIDYVFQPDLDRVLRTAVQAGAAPDILATPGPGFVLEYVNAGFVLPMDNYAGLYGWKDKLLGWAYDTGTLQGKLYSLPLTYESMIVFYNKTLFDKQGWKIPTNRAEIEALADECLKMNIYPFAYGNGDWKPATEHIITMINDHYAGADNVYKALIGEKKWTDPEFVEAMKLLNDWFHKGYYSGSIDNYHALGWSDDWPNLATGKGAMMMCGTWGFQGAPGAFTDAKQEWDWFPMPSLRDGVHPVYSLGIGQTLSINGKSPNPDKAAEALDFVFNDPKRGMLIASGFQFGEWVIPVPVTQADFPAGVLPQVSRYYEDFGKVTGAGDYGYTTWTFWPAKTEVYLYQGFDDVMAGNITAEQYMANIQTQFDEELKAGKVPPTPKRNV